MQREKKNVANMEKGIRKHAGGELCRRLTRTHTHTHKRAVSKPPNHHTVTHQWHTVDEGRHTQTKPPQ